MSLEDYTTYTELDPNSRLTVAANKITAAALQTNTTAYVYDDKGVDFFDGDYTHYLNFEKTGGSGGAQDVFLWGISNVVANGRTLFTTHLAHQIFMYATTIPILRLMENRGGTTAFDDSIGLALNTRYWLTITRDESIGSFGQLKCFIYSDSARTILVDTLTVNLASKQNFRYAYGINADNYGGGDTWSGDVSDLDVGIAAEVAGNINRKLGKGLCRGTMRGL